MIDMELRTFTTFEADFPDDGEFAGSGDIKRPSGRNVALFLCDLLRNEGLEVSDPRQHSYFGWAFDVSDKDITLWFLLQYPGPWLLLSQRSSSLIQKVLGFNSKAQHRRILELLNETLARNSRFRKIQWFTKEAFAKGAIQGCGASIP